MAGTGYKLCFNVIFQRTLIHSHCTVKECCRVSPSCRWGIIWNVFLCVVHMLAPFQAKDRRCPQVQIQDQFTLPPILTPTIRRMKLISELKGEKNYPLPLSPPSGQNVKAPDWLKGFLLFLFILCVTAVIQVIVPPLFLSLCCRSLL